MNKLEVFLNGVSVLQYFTWEDVAEFRDKDGVLLVKFDFINTKVEKSEDKAS
jgi:hypothetical protein